MDFSIRQTAPGAGRAQPYAVFRTAPNDPLAAALACSGAGVQHAATWLAERRLDCYAAVLVDDGTGLLETDSAGRQRVEAPALFVLFPGERHAYGPDPGTLWHEQWLLFGGSLAAAFEAAGLLERRRPLLPLARGGALGQLFGRIRDELSAGRPYCAPAAAALVFEVIAAARRAVRSDVDPRHAEAEAIEAAIREAAFGPLDLAAIGRRLGLSEATLRRRMLARHGLAPKAYQLQLRLDRAKELLATGAMPVQAIATAVGFDDPYYFSRLFRSREGISPSRFRAENRRG